MHAGRLSGDSEGVGQGRRPGNAGQSQGEVPGEALGCHPGPHNQHAWQGESTAGLGRKIQLPRRKKLLQLVHCATHQCILLNPSTLIGYVGHKCVQ